ncbi:MULTISPECIES: hydantoinase/oxoprolinase family protein [Bradyrhizobium]|uniref:Hydantoinase A n=3 Tax=Bradyrhizobium TaxID=374 RepID=A0A410VIW1_9BRAD|nr:MULTISPECIES: hydantoinase/oxoprolinase family protein [Bradyrhizobium]MCG2628023.1 hydantoinase/oxoprolinase family protein [Bradyrhizobium zhengyangense]MCG2643142.1 hydantoinase/oxoprolinase family protein [Bradyrhizobium zhengyangense]MCG2670544.1 hydantoinase/oxoprolinase family protein [Bradyrhizobium zhengyangense]MDN4985721.1 hydantoinase/oxoprolinase family protein [Bradyrhizobium sp. WYCCWR 13022]MDT4736562.1 hydantoinase/oxoprolinase family protein [Bradyrhizobium sp. WYCCWR 1269
MYSLGIDIGGTFTDIVLYCTDDGRVVAHKELTTPHDPTIGALAGVKQVVNASGTDPDQIGRVVHATTLFTNALIERRGARTGLITTSGFRDTLDLQREFKYDLYDLFLKLPKPLIEQDDRVEVNERTLFNGHIQHPLNEDELLIKTRRLLDRGVTSLAVSFLHSYANGTNELRAKSLIERHFPQVQLSISSEVCPQIREYERTSTTAANAYIKPIADKYLRELEVQLKAFGIPGALFMMLSNGGLTHIEEARRTPIELLESGPAAGTLVAAYFGKRSGFDNVLAFDMGGTTAKLGVIENGEPLIAYQFEAARQKRFAPGSGLPVNISTVELIEIGAGGGSIAHVDELGMLKVGPQSAGSRPGPACYPNGGTAPTVTDANVVSGAIDVDNFAGGTMVLRRGAAEAALTGVGHAIEMPFIKVANGIQAIVNETMAAAARVHVAERGHDITKYKLIVTGGGGPMHGCDVARRLGIKQVICPPNAGVASALGLLIAPARVDRSRTLGALLGSMEIEKLEAAFRRLEDDTRRVIAQARSPHSTLQMERRADIRFVGQGSELVTGLPVGPYSESERETIRAAFIQTYKGIFGDIIPDLDLEIMNIRVTLKEVREPAKLGRMEDPPRSEGSRYRPVYDDATRAWVKVPVLRRSELGIAGSIEGPALLDEQSSTLVVPRGSRMTLDASGNVIVQLRDDGDSVTVPVAEHATEIGA